MANRITSAYIEGAHLDRPAGFSEILFTDIIPKFHEACKIHSLTEQVRIDISQFLLALSSERGRQLQADEQGLKVLTFLEKNLFSLSSFCFMKGNTDRHIFPADLLDSIEELDDQYKQEVIDPNTDFLIHRSLEGLHLDQLKVHIRSLESTYWSWYYDRDYVVPHVFTHILFDEKAGVKKLRNMKLMGDILNRLSTFLFWFNRDFHRRNSHIASLPVQWAGKIVETAK